MLVQRTWLDLAPTNKTDITTYTDLVHIWDSGSLRYERFSNNDEYSWEIVSREFNDSGFTEVLKEIPLYKCPFNLVWQESYPALMNSQGFQIPGWSVVQKILVDTKAKPENSPVPGRGYMQRGRGGGRGRGNGRNMNR